MYLEISARRTGKTFRLIEEVRRRVMAGKHIILIYPNWSMPKGVLPKDILSSPHVLVDIYAKYNTLEERYPGSVWFFDEFDMHSSVLPIKEDGYYVTTPSSIRDSSAIRRFKYSESNDNLLRLIHNNDYFYNAYVCPHAGEIEGKFPSYSTEFGHQLFKQ